MSEHQVRNVIEAALLVAGKPLGVSDLAQLFDESGRPDAATIRACLGELALSYQDRGIELKETANGMRIQIRGEYATQIGRLWPERPQRYSRALLETLALVAYRQPITRAEIEGVRGVAVNPNILKTLMERGWLRVVGHREVPGRPELLGTTGEFLDYFGLKKIEELPPLAELKALADSHLQLELPGTRVDVIDDAATEALDASGTLQADYEDVDNDADGDADDELNAAAEVSGGMVAAARDQRD